MAGDHSAPGPAAGFAFQFERALLWLAESPSGAAVGVEAGDDVVVKVGGKLTVSEQDKHVTSGPVPFGNRSHSLWNTLKIWLEVLEARRGESSSVEFYLASNATLPECIASRLAQAESDTAIQGCISELKAAAISPPAAIAALMADVLGYGDEALAALIARIRLADSSPHSDSESLRKTIADKLNAPAQSSATIVHGLLGWLHEVVLDQWRAKKPGWVEKASFVRAYHTILDRLRRERRAARAEHLLPVVSASEFTEHRARVFVEQIRLIDLDDDDVDEAVRHFVLALHEALRLSREGDVTRDEWLALEGQLVTEWKRIAKLAAKVNPAATAQAAGQNIYYTTLGYRATLAGVPVDEPYLTRGTYHRLADDLRVGWHPEFEKMLGPGARK